MRRRGAHPTSNSFTATSVDYCPGPGHSRAGAMWLAVRLPLDARLEAALRAMARVDGGEEGRAADVAVLKLEGSQPAGKRVFREIGREGGPPAADLPLQSATAERASTAPESSQSLEPKRKLKLGRAVDVTV